jgi:tripartite-type tricarboxylate transporter receptor subunit TctC
MHKQPFVMEEHSINGGLNWGQPVIVDSRAGAGGTIPTDQID